MPTDPHPTNGPHRPSSPPDSDGDGDDGPAVGTAGSVSRAAMLGVVALAVLLVALVVLVTQRDPISLPAGSPEATVQAWLQSLVDGQPDTSLLADQSCGPVDGQLFMPDRLRIVVRDSTVAGDTAEVQLEVTEDYGAGVLDDGYQHLEVYSLQRTDDGWRITTFEWPWDPCFAGDEEAD